MPYLLKFFIKKLANTIYNFVWGYFIISAGIETYQKQGIYYLIAYIILMLILYSITPYIDYKHQEKSNKAIAKQICELVEKEKFYYC